MRILSKRQLKELVLYSPQHVARMERALPSVRVRGVLVPLLVRPKPCPQPDKGRDANTAERPAPSEAERGDPGHYEIVAGRRRFLAAKAVAEERGETVTLPCAVIEAGDDAAALEMSLIENFARLDPDEVSQWETFARLVREGRSVEHIAATFGVTERMVRRILALGNLLVRLRSLYRQGQIDTATVRQLTLATKAQQREWLDLYDSPDAYAPTGHRLKDWLFGGHAIPTSAALFDLASYPAPIVADLFGEDSYFADSEAFWQLQNEAIAAKRADYLEAGWTAAELLEPGAYFPQWDFDKRPKHKGGKVYIAVSAKGEVEVHEGWLPSKEARRSQREEVPLPAPRPELTSAMRTYVDLHRHAAVRARLIDHPGVALRVMVAHAIAGSPLWSVRPEPQRADRSSIMDSVAQSDAEAVFAEKRRAAQALLGFDPESPRLVGGAGYGGVDSMFARLLALSDDQVLAVLAVVMGETLAAGSPSVETVGTHIGLDMASLWQADEAFFELLRDRAVLTALVEEVAGLDVAEANCDETGKALKAIIRDCLAGTGGRPQRAGWVPAWLRFPAGSYAAGEEPEAEQPFAEAAE